MNTYTTNNTNSCDKCGRSLDGKGWIEISGMKICGICQYENNYNEGEKCNLYQASGTEDSCDYCGRRASEHFLTTS